MENTFQSHLCCPDPSQPQVLPLLTCIPAATGGRSHRMRQGLGQTAEPSRAVHDRREVIFLFLGAANGSRSNQQGGGLPQGGAIQWKGGTWEPFIRMQHPGASCLSTAPLVPLLACSRTLSQSNTREGVKQVRFETFWERNEQSGDFVTFIQGPRLTVHHPKTPRLNIYQFCNEWKHTHTCTHTRKRTHRHTRLLVKHTEQAQALIAGRALCQAL